MPFIEEIDFLPREELGPYINCIMIQENEDPDSHMNLPLYADGFPGIMFQQSDQGFFMLPQNKELSELFLYGQTLEPISLDVKGPYLFVVVQLYPFASKYLLGVDPKVLNDDCYDLLQIDQLDVKPFHQALIQAQEMEERVQVISDLMLALIKANQVPQDDRIQQAIHLILQRQGNIKVSEVLDQVFMTERTLERQFLAQTGLTPKQFARIIQFQSSLYKLTDRNFSRLTEVGFDSGFTDQSHFIRSFKKYTGQTPSFYLKHLSIR